MCFVAFLPTAELFAHSFALAANGYCIILQVSTHDTGAEAVRVAASSNVLRAIGSAKEDAGLQSALAKRALQEEDPDMETDECEEDDESIGGEASDDDALMEAQADIGFSLLEGSSNKRAAVTKKDPNAAKKMRNAFTNPPPVTEPATPVRSALSLAKGRGKGSLNKAQGSGLDDSEMTPGQEALVAKGEESLQKMKTNYSAEKLWEGGVRSRQIDALQKSSSQISAKLSALPMTCQRGHDLSTDIMAQVSSIEQMFELFTLLRADISPFLDTMETESEDVLLSCDMSVLSGMLLKTAAEFIKKTDSQASRLKARLWNIM